MSTMRSDRKPPLAKAKSPVSLRPPRRVLRSSAPSLQTPSGRGSVTKSVKPIRRWETEESEYHSISCELRALAKMVESELVGTKSEKGGSEGSMFERGRLYEEYSARRNERLKRKMGETPTAKTVYGLGVNVESGKRRDTKKRESLRKSVATVYAEETPRYMLRSMSKDKENRKPPLPITVNSDKSLFGGERKMGLRRGKI